MLVGRGASPKGTRTLGELKCGIEDDDEWTLSSKCIRRGKSRDPKNHRMSCIFGWRVADGFNLHLSSGRWYGCDRHFKQLLTRKPWQFRIWEKMLSGIVENGSGATDGGSWRMSSRRAWRKICGGLWLCCVREYVGSNSSDDGDGKAREERRKERGEHISFLPSLSLSFLGEGGAKIFGQTFTRTTAAAAAELLSFA